MSVDPRSKEAQTIRKLIPFDRISICKFDYLCMHLCIEDMAAGNFLFKQGDSENELIYLLKGRISLQTDEFKVETIKPGTDASKFALAHQIPRKIDARAETNISFIRLDADIMKIAQNSQIYDAAHPMIDENNSGDDWMTTLLKSPIFRALPPANLQRILMGLENRLYRQGETIIEQGEQGDFYYLIKSGQCLITRKPTPSAKEIKLAVLNGQDTFGEDSILSDEPRNVTVRALSEVDLLRLDKENFVLLIQNPTLKYIDYQAISTLSPQESLLLDVRAPDEFEKIRLDNSINVPFFSLRMHIKNLSQKKTVVVMCETGNISKAAAFLLLKNRIDSLVLRGGLANIPKQMLTHAATFATHDRDNAGRHESDKQTKLPGVGLTKPMAAENELEQLRDTVIQLEEKCQLLTAERDALSKKYNELLQQSEKLQNAQNDPRNPQP